MGTPLIRGLSIAIVVLVLDQASKWWILEHVMQPPRRIEVLPFFNLVLGWNRGMSFGLFNTDAAWTTWVFTLIAAAIIVVLMAWLARGPRVRVAAGIGLVIGGALGNVVDRVARGAVVDFLDVHAAGWHWPAFNVADSAITVGAAILVLDSLFSKPENGSG